MRSKSGFTIVELLIVIVVIAILAAITIVAYNGIQNRAYDSAVQSDFNKIASKLEVYKITDQDNKYPTGGSANPGDLRAVLSNINISLAVGSYSTEKVTNLLYIDNDAGTNFGIIAKSKSGTIYTYTSKDKAVKVYDDDPIKNYPSVASTTVASELDLVGSNVNFAVYNTSSNPGDGWRIWQ